MVRYLVRTGTMRTIRLFVGVAHERAEPLRNQFHVVLDDPPELIDFEPGDDEAYARADERMPCDPTGLRLGATW